MQIVFCVIDESQRAGKQVTAETKAKSKGFRSQEAIDLHWVGGGLADLLNADTELKTMLLKMQQTKIRIEPDNERKCVVIFGHYILYYEPEVYSMELFEAYDRIARHVRTALTLGPDRESG